MSNIRAGMIEGDFFVHIFPVSLIKQLFHACCAYFIGKCSSAEKTDVLFSRI